MDFLLPTLTYLTIGLWLTTALVEQLADVFRLVHYAGRQVTDVKRVRPFENVGNKINTSRRFDSVKTEIGVTRIGLLIVRLQSNL